jgi:hypothetical protein
VLGLGRVVDGLERLYLAVGFAEWMRGLCGSVNLFASSIAFFWI